MKAGPCRLLSAWALLAVSVSCASTRNPAGSQERNEYTLAEDVSVRRIAPGVWVHTTLSGEELAHYPANGLIVEDGDGAILVDTAWSPRQTELLLAWAQDELHHPVRAAVVTHFHSDRTAGVPVLTARGLPVYGLEETVRLGTANGSPVPSRTFKEVQDLGPLELFFPGAGHARDNLVVWHRSSGVLFGGCFVKAGDAKDLGNVADADTVAWPVSLERTRTRFPEARIVVPGHGPVGGPELLTHTQELLRAKPAAR